MSRSTSELSQARFIVKLIIAGSLTLAGAWLATVSNLMLNLLGTVLLGAMFAHAVELQHQCLHNTAFKSKTANRFVGIILGLPLLSSFHEYQRTHLTHHRHLGTTSDQAFFAYRFAKSTKFWNFLFDLVALTHLSHVLSSILAQIPSLSRRSQSLRKTMTRRERCDYVIMAALLTSAYLWSMVTGSLLPIKLWLIPMLLVGQPLHFLIELPEHIGCRPNTTDVFQNTRTIVGSRFSTWFTNGNNFHVEHHLAPAIPMDQMVAIYHQNQGKHRYLHPSYAAFYRSLLKALRADQALDHLNSMESRTA